MTEQEVMAMHERMEREREREQFESLLKKTKEDILYVVDGMVQDSKNLHRKFEDLQKKIKIFEKIEQVCLPTFAGILIGIALATLLFVL